MTVTIEFVESYKDIDEDLWTRCFSPPFEGLFWYRTLETCGIEDQFKFSYALIKNDGVSVGIAPCFLHDVPMSLVVPPRLASLLQNISRVFPQAGYQRTLFVGSPCADEGTIGLVDGVALEDVIAPLAVAVQAWAKKSRAPMVVFKDFPEEVQPALSKLVAAQKFFSMVSYPGTLIKLAGSGREDYVSNLSRNQRQNFRRKLRRSRETIDLTTEYVKRPDDEQLDELFSLFMQTYEKGKTKFEKLDIQFFKLIRECEPAWFMLQREKSTGKLITFMLLFKIGDRMVNKFIGLDYAKAGQAFLFFRQFEGFVDFAYMHKCKELQSGQTGYRVKIDLGHTMVPLFNICRHANPLLNKIYAAVAKDINWESLDSDLLQVKGASEAGASPASENNQEAN